MVATTNNSAAELDADFDLVVADEATQATIRSTLIPLSKGDRVVLAGDHRQLPPFDARTAPADDDRHRSLFEHLYAEDGVYGRRIGTMLTTQYRMHEDVAAFPDREFYDGALEDGRVVESIDGLPALVRVDVEGPERVGEGHSYANPAEAERAASLVAELLAAGIRPENVGVITPYDAQVDEIRRALSDAGVPNHGDVEVDTVDAFQGGEREAVVVSLVRSNDEGNVGFLGRGEDGPRRLNVALTRAERFLALVGDWGTLRASADGDDGENGNGENGDGAADLYRSLYDYLDERGRRLSDEDELGG